MNTTLLSKINHDTQLLTPLPYTFISVQGSDAEKFLQGQLSCDLSLLNGQNLSFGTLNSPKGRMYGLFKIVVYKDGFLLRLENSTAKLFLLTLNKYKVFFKCVISIEEQFSAFAYTADSKSEPNLPQNAKDKMSIGTNFISRLSNNAPLYEIWSQELNEHKAEIGTDTESWFAMEAKLGIPELYAETQDQFILQYLNLQDLGAVSFKKGCYTGQEIVARMQYLGKLKRHLYRGKVPAGQNIELATAIFSEGHEGAVSQVVSVAYENDHAEILLVLDKKYLQTPLFLSETNGPQIELLSLPYEIEVEEPKEE